MATKTHVQCKQTLPGEKESKKTRKKKYRGPKREIQTNKQTKKQKQKQKNLIEIHFKVLKFDVCMYYTKTIVI